MRTTIIICVLNIFLHIPFSNSEGEIFYNAINSIKLLVEITSNFNAKLSSMIYILLLDEIWYEYG